MIETLFSAAVEDGGDDVQKLRSIDRTSRVLAEVCNKLEVVLHRPFIQTLPSLYLPTKTCYYSHLLFSTPFSTYLAARK